METSRIAAFPVFADLPEAELDELAGAVHELAVAERSTVVTVDDYGDAVYLVEEGTAGVLNERGETTQTLGAGDTFGEIGLLLTGQRTATVVARSPLKLLSLSGADFERIRSRVPELEQTLRRLGLERASR
jgi:CRP-like cAMP-binding protein